MEPLISRPVFRDSQNTPYPHRTSRIWLPVRASCTVDSSAACRLSCPHKAGSSLRRAARYTQFSLTLALAKRLVGRRIAQHLLASSSIHRLPFLRGLHGFLPGILFCNMLDRIIYIIRGEFLWLPFLRGLYVFLPGILLCNMPDQISHIVRGQSPSRQPNQQAHQTAVACMFSLSWSLSSNCFI